MSYKNKAIIFLTSVSIAFGQEVNLSPFQWFIANKVNNK